VVHHMDARPIDSDSPDDTEASTVDR